MSLSTTFPLHNIPKTDEDVHARKSFSSNWESFKSEIKELFTFHPREWVNAFRRNPKYPLFALGDIDGFIALFMNNLAILFGVILGLKHIFDPDLIYGKLIPG
jgi:hypothetical protein